MCYTDQITLCLSDLEYLKFRKIGKNVVKISVQCDLIETQGEIKIKIVIWQDCDFGILNFNSILFSKFVYYHLSPFQVVEQQTNDQKAVMKTHCSANSEILRFKKVYFEYKQFYIEKNL